MVSFAGSSWSHADAESRHSTNGPLHARDTRSERPLGRSRTSVMAVYPGGILHRTAARSPPTPPRARSDPRGRRPTTRSRAGSKLATSYALSVLVRIGRRDVFVRHAMVGLTPATRVPSARWSLANIGHSGLPRRDRSGELTRHAPRTLRAPPRRDDARGLQGRARLTAAPVTRLEANASRRG
jgi:hypothetical protein